MNFMALVDGKPRELTIKDFLREFLRHRVQVIRRRTQFLLSRARQQKHTDRRIVVGAGRYRSDYQDHSAIEDPGGSQTGVDGNRMSRPR